jgi:hypothetical protein
VGADRGMMVATSSASSRFLTTRFASAYPFAIMTPCAKGTFEIQATPHPLYDESDGVTLGRMTFQKQFQGDLEATSVVEMMAARTPIAASAGYVALERVHGRLHGRSGSFVLAAQRHHEPRGLYACACGGP